ncbi:MAG: peptidylprolyl isomerase [Proteobacteria bacterium]|nr:peptidylprolyl isomerase [Pseudomonadota bacterium]
MSVWARVASVAAVLVALALPAAAQQNKENTLIMQTSVGGPVVIEMRPDLAPKHVAQIKALVRKKYYDGVVFHRVMEGFMAQTGDPTGTGSGPGSGNKLKAEFNREPHVRGTVSMARVGGDNDSADSQFFICFAPANFLDGQYTVWGKVVSGMEFVDKIKKGAPRSGTVTNPDKIVSLRVAADAN